MLPFGFTQSVKLCQILVETGRGEKDGDWQRGEGGLQVFLLFWSSGNRGWVGIARVSFRSDVHCEFFLHKNVLLLRQKGFVQSLAFPGAALAHQSAFKLEAAPWFTLPFSATAVLSPFPIRIILCFLLCLHWVTFFLLVLRVQ